MKTSISFCIVTLVVLCAADFGDLPDCAKGCASDIPAECNLDIGCICKSNNWLENISCCISSNCPAKDQGGYGSLEDHAHGLQDVALMISIDTIDQAQKICKIGGVSLASTLPPCATSTGAVAASSTGSSDSSDTTTTDTTATTAASESVVTTTASASTATATPSEAVVTTTASESTASESTATATASSSDEDGDDTTTSASSTRATAAIGGNPGAAANSPSAAASTGAANHLMVPGVGAAGLAFAAFALL